jgi:hypothetical protein
VIEGGGGEREKDREREKREIENYIERVCV